MSSYEITFQVYARMTIEADTYEEAEAYFENLGTMDYPFEIQNPDSVEELEMEEIDNEV